MVVMYASLKATDVYERRNPIVNILNLPDALDEDSKEINMRDSNFRIAFALEKASKPRDDEKYVR